MPRHWRHINGRSMLSSFISLRGKTKVLESLCVISTVLIVFGSVIEGHAQSTERPGPSNSDGKNQEQAYAPLGESGYRVPIPEIRMDQILGGRPAKPKPPQPEKDESSSPQSNIVEPAERNEPEQSERQETSVTPEPPRLPFDPAVRKTVPGPILQRPNIEEPSSMAPPLPKENVSPLSAPFAPEDPMIARPPKKEVLMKRTPPTTPPLLEAQPSKETLKSIHLKAQGTPFSGPIENIPLGSRGEPEIIPRRDPEPKPLPASSPEAEPESKPLPASLPETEPEPKPLPEPVTGPVEPVIDKPAPKERTLAAPSSEPEPHKLTPEDRPFFVPSLEPDKSGPKERTLIVPPMEPVQEQSIPKETLPVFTPPAPPPKEVLRSPLNDDIPDTPEIKYYFRDTAPILEELSLLMTRAPSMTTADYDPSDANAPLFSKDLQLRMDSMKRDLQILDSKTFAIIPPKRYEQFHDLIRDSITHTHQACDAILNYIAEPNEENFKLIQDHLFRARELIQKKRAHE